MDKIWKEPSKLNRIMIYGILTSLILFSVTLYFYNEAYLSRNIDAHNRVSEISNQYLNAVSNQINGDLSTLVAIASFINEEDLEKEEQLLESFSDVIQQNGFLRMSLTSLDSSAFMIDNQGNKTYNHDFSKRSEIQQGLQGEVTVSASFLDEISGEYINCYVVPILKKNKVIGAITAVHKSERFYSILVNGALFDGQGQTSIVDRHGNYVIRGYEKHQLFEDYISQINNPEQIDQLLSVIDQQETDVFNILINNSTYICSVIPLGINDWSVNTLVAMDYFHLGYERLVIIFTIAILILIGIFVTLSLFVKKIMKKSRESIIQVAYYDSLTGIFNRNRFMDFIKENSNRLQIYAFVLLDVNNFKFINETYGYQNGDMLLCYIASVLEKHTHKDEFCFRDNADRFGMLLIYNTKEQLNARLNRILDDIAGYHFEDTENDYIVCNCGIEIIDNTLGEGENIDPFFDRAIIALNHAKGNHVSTIVYFDKNMEEIAQARFVIEKSLHAALINNEFKLYLQPKVSVLDNKVVGAEALVRWVVDNQVLHYPDEFIPICEENGFICELDLLMLEEVCRCLKRGIDLGYKMIPFSINQSKVLFYRPHYLESITKILDRYNIDPSLIIIEVTESITFENIDKIKEIIQGLHEFGFKVSLDDFGSGYSSLNVLQNLDIDEVKLDREFLIADKHETKQRRVIESVVQLARNLNIATVSEGVETEEQLNFLRSIHCDIAQGYYFSKPVPYLTLMRDIYIDSLWDK